jgi:uncharacterized protein YqhQ
MEQTDQRTHPRLQLFGGRALRNGVMMTGAGHCAVAVRLPDGDIRVNVEPYPMPAWISTVPFLRGILVIPWTLYLTFISSRQEMRLARKDGGSTSSGIRAQVIPIISTAALAQVAEVTIEKSFMRSSGMLARTFGRLSRPLFGAIAPLVTFNIATRASGNSELLRYHAAEHMAINSQEAGVELSGQNAMSFSRIHPRCGTSFATLCFALTWLVGLTKRRRLQIVLTPFIWSLAYEIARFGANKRDNPIVATALMPVWGTQRLTTLPASLEHVEVAIAALQAVIDAGTPNPQAESPAIV